MDFLYLVKLTHSIIIILHLFLLEIYKNLFALSGSITFIPNVLFTCRTLMFKINLVYFTLGVGAAPQAVHCL